MAGVAGADAAADGRADPAQAAVTNPAHTTSASQPERIRPVHHPHAAKSHRNGEAAGVPPSVELTCGNGRSGPSGCSRYWSKPCAYQSVASRTPGRVKKYPPPNGCT